MATQEERLQFRMEANIRQMERALAQAEARVVKSANQIDKEFTRANRSVERGVSAAAREVEAGTQAMSRFGNITNNQRFIIQNTAAQFGDMAVQLGMGTNALTVMGQQLPQILGPIGVMGALLGVAAAVLAPLANYMLNAGSGADTMKKSVDALNAALETSERASELARSGIGGLLDQFGRGGKDVQALVDSLEQISVRQVVDAARGTAGTLTDMYSGSGLMNRSRRESLTAAFGYGGRDINAIAAGMEAVKSAANVDQQLAAVTQLREAFLSIAGPVEQMTARELDLYISIADTQEGLIKAAQRIKEGTEANTSALAKQYEIMAQSRAESAAALASAQEILATQERELAMAQAIAEFGSKSAEVAALKVEAEREALVQSLENLDVAESLKDQILASFDAAKSLAGVDASIGLEKAAQSAAKIANELQRAVGNAISLASNAGQDLELAKINYEFRGDAVGRARAAAELEFNRANALTSAQTNSASGAIATVLINAQREAFIAARVEAVGYTEALSAWNKAQTDAAKGGRSAAKAIAGSDDQILKDIAALNAETEAIKGLAAGADEYGNALARARKEAEMLQTLRNKGINITPELQAQVSAKAQDWFDAAEQNSRVREAYDEMQDAAISAGEVRDATGEMFRGMLTDAENARDHMVGFMSNLLNQVLNNMLAGPTKILGDAATSFLSGFLPGAASPAQPRAGGGGVRAGHPYLVNEATANSEIFVPGRSGAILNVQQAQAALRASAAPVRSSGGPQNVSVDVRTFMDENGNWQSRVEGISYGAARRMTAQGMAIQSRMMPGKIADDRRRGVNG